MNLSDIQKEAWTCAESKGLHANLDGMTRFGAREQALMALVPVYQAISAMTQHIKRHGIDDRSELTIYFDNAMLCFASFYQSLNAFQQSMPIKKGDIVPATWVRLALTHTELDECAESAATDTKDEVAAELADIVIRIADLAECVGVNLEEATEKKLAYNKMREYGYGTPLCGSSKREDPRNGQ